MALDNKSILKIVSFCLGAVGLILSKITDVVAEKQMEVTIDERIEKKLNELNNEQ